jgi:hypothetical protein
VHLLAKRILKRGECLLSNKCHNVTPIKIKIFFNAENDFCQSVLPNAQKIGVSSSRRTDLKKVRTSVLSFSSPKFCACLSTCFLKNSKPMARWKVLRYLRLWIWCFHIVWCLGYTNSSFTTTTTCFTVYPYSDLHGKKISLHLYAFTCSHYFTHNTVCLKTCP